jgi:ferredoxin-nitrite reductase
VGVSTPVGRLTPDDVLEFARISKKYGSGEIRNCNSQNLIIPNIADEKIETLLKEEIFKKYPIEPNKLIGYSVACTGNEYCNLALVETKERMHQIALHLDEELSLDVPVRIHMVGCPNSCGQRQIADLGLHGVLMKNKDKKLVEAFEIYIGGTLNDGGKFNEKLKGKIEADQLEDVVKELLVSFNETKLPGENYFDYVNRVGKDFVQAKLDDVLSRVTA